MNTTRNWVGIVSLMGVLSGAASLAETMGTAFTYQGQLKQDGVPVNDTCEFDVGLWTAEVGGDELGAQIVETEVTNGLFTIKLNETSQFGANAFNGDRRWLDIGVSCPPGGTFVPLGRQELTPAPYAMRAIAGGGGPGGNTLDQAYDQGGAGAGRTITADAGAVEILGPGGLTVVGTIQSGSSIIIDGTTDTITSTADLELHVSSGRALRMEEAGPNADNKTGPNLIGGFAGNSVTAGAMGATIGGGGSVDHDPGNVRHPNSVSDDFGTVSGGVANQAGDNDEDPATGPYATVGGGAFNSATGAAATVPGGDANTAAGRHSFAAGRRAQANHDGTFVWSDRTTPFPEFFSSTGDNQFLINASGGVGIGTNDPRTPLHIQKEGPGADVFMDGFGGSTSFIGRRANGTTAAPTAVQAGEGLVTFGGRGYGDNDFSSSTTGNMVIWAAENWSDAAHGTYMTFTTTPAGSTSRRERMRIDDTGKVGIGTREPDALLDIVADQDTTEYIHLRGFDNDQAGVRPVMHFQRSRGSIDTPAIVSNGDRVGTILGTPYDGTAYRPTASLEFYVDGEPGPADMPTRIEFLTTSDGSASRQRRLVIKNDGKVGIGTTDPKGKLHVKGTTWTELTVEAQTNDPALQLTSDGSATNNDWTMRMDVSNADKLQFRYDNDAKVTVDTAGNVGIGTTAPAALLDIQADQNVNNYITLSGFDDDEAWKRPILSFLRARGSASAPAIVANGDLMGTIVAFAYDGDQYHTPAAITFRTDGEPGNDDMPGRIEFRTTPDGSAVRELRMVIKNNGRVGIGTVNPSDPLHIVNDEVNTDIMLESTNGGTADRTRIWMKTAERLWSLENDGALNLFKIRDQTATKDRLVIDYDGKVGIGTDDPAAQLHVRGVSTGFLMPSQLVIQGSETTGNSNTGGAVSFRGHDGTQNREWGSVGGRKEDADNDTSGFLQFKTVGPDNPFAFERMRIAGNGEVGIGTTDPQATLHVEGTARVDGLMTLRDPGDQETIWINPNAGGGGAMVLLNNGAGQKTIQLDADANDDGIMTLYDADGNLAIKLHSDSAYSASEISLYALNSSGVLKETVEIIASETSSGGLSSNGGQILLRDSNGFTTITLDAELGADGPSRITTSTLEITGADLAEKFPVSEEVMPGMVVAIDPDRPGQLCVARGVYNRRVAGVVSGANGLSVGVILGNLPGSEDAPPIAMSGRVYVWADASNGPIETGDLLTTSATPGHAMKVTDFALSQGAILGKAMTSLDEGTGLILVLVSLQ